MIEVLKQMVEALEWCHGGEPVGTADAIKAGKKLIAELESQEPDVVMHWHSHTWTTINPPPKNSGDVNLYYAPPQRTEQEPVAWAGVDFDIKTHPPQRPRVVFPTMLRKMWSGGEVQAWLDENVNKENT